MELYIPNEATINGVHRDGGIRAVGRGSIG
jgi:hypothetical protein